MFNWNKFPYSNMNKLNLQWVIEQIQSNESNIEEIQALIEALQLELELAGTLTSVSPDSFTGTDLEKLQQAVDFSIENDRIMIIIDREYDLLGGTVYVNNEIRHDDGLTVFGREPVRFLGIGLAKLSKTDTGFMFSSNPDRAGDVLFQNITFEGYITNDGVSSLKDNKVFDCNQLIRITSLGCFYKYFNNVFYQDGEIAYNMQSIKSIGDTIVKCGDIVNFNEAWDVSFTNCMLEDSNRFIKGVDLDSNIRNLAINQCTIEGMINTAIDIVGNVIGVSINNNYFEANQNHISMVRSNDGGSITGNTFLGRGNIDAGDIIKCIEIALKDDSIVIDGNFSTETNVNTILISVDTTSVYDNDSYKVAGSNGTSGSTRTDAPDRILRMLDIIEKTGRVRARNTSDQATTSGVTLTVAYNVTDYDDSDEWDFTNPTRLTAVGDGWRTITGQLSYESNAVGYRKAFISSSVKGAIASVSANAVSGVNTDLLISTSIYMTDGEYLELKTSQNSGTGLNVVANGQLSPVFTMTKG